MNIKGGLRAVSILVVSFSILGLLGAIMSGEISGWFILIPLGVLSLVVFYAGATYDGESKL